MYFIVQLSVQRKAVLIFKMLNTFILSTDRTCYHVNITYTLSYFTIRLLDAYI